MQNELASKDYQIKLHENGSEHARVATIRQKIIIYEGIHDTR